MSLAAMPMLGAADAEARAHRPAKRFAHQAPLKPAKPAKPAKNARASYGPLLAVVSLRSQRIRVYGSDGLIAQSVVSTGQPGFPTPEGVFSVIQKNRFHRSNIYSAAPMPFMQRITWSGVALHAGVVPGYPASHGCIRLTPAFAAELWRMTRVGARVVIAPDDVEAHELTHAALPVPATSPAPDKVASAEDVLTKVAVATSAAGSDRPLETGAAPQRLLLPMERALAAKARTAAEAIARARAAKAALKLSGEKTAEANKAVAALRNAQMATASARTRLEAATRAVEKARTPAAAERATAAQAAARAALDEAETAAAEAAREQDGKTSEAFNAVRAAWDAEEASAQADAAKETAARGIEPVSILISRKAGRIYVRQAWAPVYEAPVTFKEPELPLGTHLYLATAAEEGGRGLRWLSVSMPAAPPRAEPSPHRPGRTRGQAAAPPPAPVAQPNVTAAQALDRVELSPEARAFIEDRLWAGAALIVTDHGISGETRKTTDFIVLTR